ncbi:MAG: cbb3-type cytochrome oxidase assembly protein CcoS [Flavobacterium sp.]|nr:MAG: cbb3-type cytochrome oxidase assembly protein CcoS [Flavobacterium sp.]
MNILYFLVGSSVSMALIFLGAFLWAYKTGQNDDVHTPGIRILFDDEPQKEKSEEDHFLS